MPGRIQHLEAHEVPPGGARVYFTSRGWHQNRRARLSQVIQCRRWGKPDLRSQSPGREGRAAADEVRAPRVRHRGPDTRWGSKVGWLQNIVPAGPSRLIET